MNLKANTLKLEKVQDSFSGKMVDVVTGSVRINMADADFAPGAIIRERLDLILCECVPQHVQNVQWAFGVIDPHTWEYTVRTFRRA